MTDDARHMCGNRARNASGALRATRGDKRVVILEAQYHRDFGVRSDMHVKTLLEKTGFVSVHALLQSKGGQ